MSDSEAYKIQAGTGQWQREDFPNGSYVEYTYYGADNPSQVGFVWKVEHRKANGELLIGYEYTYDLLGRVEQSVERPSGDTTVYAYTPAGRLESEVREGQVAYSRYYAYNLDGSRQWVLREDAVNGSHWDVYGYDEASGRLAWVQDVWTGEVNKFAWNPEGTLARWEEASSYARVFGYDEEGRLVKIERDYGSGGVQVAYEYGYNSDGVRVWKRDVLNGQEYRYVCRIGCGGVPMRVYGRMFSENHFTSVDPILNNANFTIHLDNYPVIVIEGANTWIIMPLSSNQSFIFINMDMFNTPIGMNPFIDDPFIILPPFDMPYPYIPTFPMPPLPPLPPSPQDILLWPWPPFQGAIGGVIPPDPAPSPAPGNPQDPDPLPYPPSSPLPPPFTPPAPTPTPGGSACERLKACQRTGEDCTVQCMECCDNFCGPGNYPKCYWKCSKSNGYFTPSDPLIHCGPMIVDKPKYPKDDTSIKDWLILLCKLLKAWGLINEHINCNEKIPIL